MDQVLGWLLAAALLFAVAWTYLRKPAPTRDRAGRELEPAADRMPVSAGMLAATAAALRHLDYLPVTCPAEHGDGPRRSALTRGELVRDLAGLRRQGWTGDERGTRCFDHSRENGQLTHLQVVCGECGERDTFRTDRGLVEFGRLNLRGWRTRVHDRAVQCPYCSGTRRRPSGYWG